MAVEARAAAPASPAVASAARAPEASTTLRFEISPLVDLWFLHRALAAAEGDPPAEHAAAVAAARALQEDLGSFGGWGPLDAYVFVVESSDELLERLRALEDPMQRGGRELSLRADAVAWAEQLVALLPRFLDVEWPAREQALHAAIDELEREFLPRHRLALGFMLESLGIADPAVEVPVYLVGDANPPGAMTYRLRGGPACVVDAVGGETSLLHEIVLHESTHTLDLAAERAARAARPARASTTDAEPPTPPESAAAPEPPERQISAFAELRALLEERGFGPRTREHHDIPHLLMFVQAAETMRRVYDPEHVAYGEATGVYQRSDGVASVIQRHWVRHLDGESSRQEALRAIVEELELSPPAH